jgi:hypothetical protein
VAAEAALFSSRAEVAALSAELADAQTAADHLLHQLEEDLQVLEQLYASVLFSVRLWLALLAWRGRNDGVARSCMCRAVAQAGGPGRHAMLLCAQRLNHTHVLACAADVPVSGLGGGVGRRRGERG